MDRRLMVIALLALLAAVALGERSALAQAPGNPPAPPPAAALTVSLTPGWNNFVYSGPTRPLSQALAAITGRYQSLWTWDTSAQRWLGVNPLVPYAGDFNELRTGRTYWLFATAAAELAMAPGPALPAPSLAPGWNNFAYAGPEQPVTEALANATGRFDTLWQWDGARQQWRGWNAKAPAISDLNTLSNQRAYFVNLAAGPQVTLGPAAIVSGAVPSSALASAPAAAIGAVPNPAPSTTSVVTPSARNSRCHGFQSVQPQLPDVTQALSRIGVAPASGGDPELLVKDLETQPDGSGNPVPAYIPPTLLKAIGWIESGWRQATYDTPRGATGETITSRSCAYGLMQVLTGMDIGNGAPSERQSKIGGDYLANIAAGAQLLGSKWNLAPEVFPVVQPRNPRALEQWYYAVWAYHCYGAICQGLGIRNNPDDPSLKWPRPAYNSPDQINSEGQYSYADYPYQELVYGVVAHPPRVSGSLLWAPVAVPLPGRGTVGFPTPQPFQPTTTTYDTP